MGLVASPLIFSESFFMIAVRVDAFEHIPKIFVQCLSSGIGSHFLDPHAFFDIELTQARAKRMRSHLHSPFIRYTLTLNVRVKSFRTPLQFWLVCRGWYDPSWLKPTHCLRLLYGYSVWCLFICFPLLISISVGVVRLTSEEVERM